MWRKRPTTAPEWPSGSAVIIVLLVIFAGASFLVHPEKAAYVWTTTEKILLAVLSYAAGEAKPVKKGGTGQGDGTLASMPTAKRSANRFWLTTGG